MAGFTDQGIGDTNMKGFILKNMLILILFLAVVSWLAAAERVQPSRILYSFLHSEFQDYSDSTSMSYQYENDTSLLLEFMDYLWIMHSSGTYGRVYTRNLYTNTIEYSGDNIEIDYCMYYYEYSLEGAIADTVNVSHVSYTLDSQGRTVAYQQDNWNDTTNSYSLYFKQFRHFNAEGELDSMFVEGQHQKYFKRIFNNGMLQSTTVYALDNGISTPEHRYTYSYAEHPAQYPASIRFDNYTTQIGEYVFEWETIFNPDWLTSSIVQEDWTNDSWVESIHFPYDVHYNQNIGITFSKEEGANLDSFVANSRGDIIVKSSDHSGLTKHTSYSWDNSTPNEDNIAPPVGNAVNVYPNPFINHLNITFDSKDNAPADYSIYNLKGQLVCRWLQQTTKQLSWDGSDRDNQAVASGVYFLRVKQGSATTIRKFIKLQ